MDIQGLCLRGVWVWIQSFHSTEGPGVTCPHSGFWVLSLCAVYELHVQATFLLFTALPFLPSTPLLYSQPQLSLNLSYGSLFSPPFCCCLLLFSPNTNLPQGNWDLVCTTRRNMLVQNSMSAINQAKTVCTALSILDMGLFFPPAAPFWWFLGLS